MRYSSSSTKDLMPMPHLYLQLQQQLSQWIKPKDKRYLQGFAEAVAAILQSGSGSLSHWLPYLSHRKCQARSQMERLSYFVHNPHIDVNCHLATANLHMANGSWAVLSDIFPSLHTFALYGKRFGGIEPHFKDYKSAAFKENLHCYSNNFSNLKRLLLITPNI